MYPVSLFLARHEIIDLFQPGEHGSTFGGNPLGAAVGLEALNVLLEEGLVENSALMGEYLRAGLEALDSPLVTDVRGQGLLVGFEINTNRTTARTVCEHLMDAGILTKETHETVVRLAPPLIIDRDMIDDALTTLSDTLASLGK